MCDYRISHTFKERDGTVVEADWEWCCSNGWMVPDIETYPEIGVFTWATSKCPVCDEAPYKEEPCKTE